MEARRPRALEIGLFLVVVASPLAFTPFTASPFGDPKLVLLALGSLLVFLGGLPHDRLLARLAVVWVAVTAAAALAGVDPLVSLGANTAGEGGGVVLALCCAVLLVAGASLPASVLGRLPRWLGWTAVAVAATQLLFRVAPAALHPVLPNLRFVGATLGNQLFSGAFMSAGVAVVAADGALPIRSRLVRLAILALGVAAAGERSSLVLPVVGVAVAIWRARLSRRDAVLTAATVLLFLAGWQLVDGLVPSLRSPNDAVAQLGSSVTDTGRFVVWRVSADAILRRPLLGWGPGTTQSAYVSTATAAQLKRATRLWADAHDLFLETAVSTGLLGLIALIALLGVASTRALRAPPGIGWSLAGAAALGAYSLVEPLNLVLTPLLFLLAGVAAGHATRATKARAPARALAAAALACGVIVASLMFAAASLEQWGKLYAETWAYRDALRLEPWRVTSSERLAILLAEDARGGPAEEASQARDVIGDAVADHPWDANVRLFQADVDTLLRNPTAARAAVAAHVARFPAEADLLEQLAAGPSGVTPGTTAS